MNGNLVGTGSVRRDEFSAIGDPDSFNGKDVILTGVKVSKLGDEDWQFFVKDDGGQKELMVYVSKGADSEAPFQVGDTLELRGEFTQYGQDWEVKINANSHDYAKEVK